MNFDLNKRIVVNSYLLLEIGWVNIAKRMNTTYLKKIQSCYKNDKYWM